MKQNPCRYCALSFEYKGKHMSGSNIECMDCENIEKHRTYLQSKRKFIDGESITSLEELLQQEWVMWNDSTRHIEVIKHQQLATVLMLIKRGSFRKAIRKESEEN